MEWWNTLEVVDKAQVISAIATAIAAIAALITTIQNRISIKKQELERHAMIKPRFMVTKTSEFNQVRKYFFEITNIGYDKLDNIVAEWEGSEKAEIELERYLKEDKSLIYTIKLSFNPERKNKEIKGKLNIIYSDILGKVYSEAIDLTFYEIIHDITGDSYLVLKEEYCRYFN